MKWWIVAATSILNTMKTLSNLFYLSIGGLQTIAARICLLLLCLGLLACGNKGPLYLPIDEEALQELENVQEEIDEAEERNRKKNSTTSDTSN